MDVKWTMEEKNLTVGYHVSMIAGLVNILFILNNVNKIILLKNIVLLGENIAKI